MSVSRMGFPLIGTASADHTSIVWGMHSGRPLLQYTGHTGSVNSVRSEKYNYLNFLNESLFLK